MSKKLVDSDNSYNPRTGVFTVPQSGSPFVCCSPNNDSGIYFLSWIVVKSVSSHGDMNSYIRVDGQRVGPYIHAYDSHALGRGGLTLPLTSGQQVDLFVSHRSIYTGHHSSVFSGFLLPNQSKFFYVLYVHSIQVPFHMTMQPQVLGLLRCPTSWWILRTVTALVQGPLLFHIQVNKSCKTFI